MSDRTADEIRAKIYSLIANNIATEMWEAPDALLGTQVCIIEGKPYLITISQAEEADHFSTEIREQLLATLDQEKGTGA